MPAEIIPGEHILTKEQWYDSYDWLHESPNTFRRNRVPHTLLCNNLVHYTENTNAARIGSYNENYFCVRGGAKMINGIYFNLSWWAAHPPDDWPDKREQIRIDIEKNLKNYEKENNLWIPSNTAEGIMKNFGKSCAFDGDSWWGPVGFIVSWESILKEYARSRGLKNPDKVERRILGTFRYQHAIMYAVLVCIEGDECCEGFPLVPPDGTEVFFYEPNEPSFIWNVCSTVGNRGSVHDVDLTKKYCEEGAQWETSDCKKFSWDYVSFAFNLPEGATLNISPRLCSIETKTATEYMPANGPRSSLDINVAEDVLEALKRKIDNCKSLSKKKVVRKASTNYKTSEPASGKRSWMDEDND